MSSRQWRRLLDRLAPARRVLAPDFLGSGENPVWTDDAPFGFEMDVAAIDELVRSLGRPVHLVGHSYGGFVALTLARKNPAAIRSLTVYDPVAFGVLHAANDTEALAGLARAEAEPVWNDLSRGGVDAWLEVFIDYWNEPGSWRTLPEGTREAFSRVGKKVFKEVHSLLADRTGSAAYGVVTAPALLLSGEKSPLAARRVVQYLSEAMPRATLRTIRGAGHMGPITHAGAVNDAIDEHIARA